MEDIPRKKTGFVNREGTQDHCVSAGQTKLDFACKVCFSGLTIVLRQKSFSSSSHLKGISLLFYLHFYVILRGKMIIYK